MSSYAIRISEKASSIDALQVSLIETAIPSPGADEAVIEIKSAGINPSDVKAMLGMMPHAVWPRTPGRDYAGVVVAGPTELIGKAGLITRMNGRCAIIAMGWKSFTGS